MPVLPFRHKRLLTVLSLLFCCAFWILCPKAMALGQRSGLYAAGVRSLALISSGKAELGALVWYPARPSGRGGRASFGRWALKAEKDAPPAGLAAPIILFSHDTAGHGLNNHELASSLASAGFMVITPTHAGDNLEEAWAMHSAALFYSRPRQMLEALAAVLADAELGALADSSRIGLLGAGAGSLTVLQLCGVDLDAPAYAAYCAATVDEALCPRWAAERLARLPADLAGLRARYGRRALARPLPGVKAVGLLTPGWLPLAHKGELAALSVPVAALFAGQDELYPTAADAHEAEKLFPALPAGGLRCRVLGGADHYSLGAACPQDMLEALPDLCSGVSEQERARLAEERDAFFAGFFRSALGLTP